MVDTEVEVKVEERRKGGDRRAGKTRVVIVDGHTLFRRGVRQILELENDIEVVGEAGSGREALATVEERYAAKSGVNIDQELAQLVQLQTAYSANARVITAVKEMMDLLLRI